MKVTLRNVNEPEAGFEIEGLEEDAAPHWLRVPYRVPGDAGLVLVFSYQRQRSFGGVLYELAGVRTPSQAEVPYFTELLNDGHLV